MASTTPNTHTHTPVEIRVHALCIGYYTVVNISLTSGSSYLRVETILDHMRSNDSGMFLNTTTSQAVPSKLITVLGGPQ